MTARLNVYLRVSVVLLAASYLALPSRAALAISEADAKRSAIDKPAPVISQLARQLKLSGKIELTVTISPSGAVQAVVPQAGNPLLIESGVIAVKKWRFKPFVENGSAIAIVTTLTFEFRQ